MNPASIRLSHAQIHTPIERETEISAAFTPPPYHTLEQCRAAPLIELSMSLSIVAWVVAHRMGASEGL